MVYLDYRNIVIAQEADGRNSFRSQMMIIDAEFGGEKKNGITHSRWVVQVGEAPVAVGT